jgi:eukaryotic-like serine/threonine-protein kinase
MSLSLSTQVLASRYRMESLIAAGGMGAVWRAVDLVLDRPVAVKLLRTEFAQHRETIARFRAEARHAAGLSHPAIAQVYDFGEASTQQPAFLVMELIDGPPLTELIAAGPLPPERVLDIVAQVAGGLAVAHAAGVVHRDIKPGNLLIAPGGIVKITDFGVAYAAGSAPLTRTGTLIGTPAYLAPERVSGEAAGPASDLYSLGMVAYECLAGRAPFTGTAMEIALAQRLRDLPPLPASVPHGVAGLINDLTAKEPESRPASAAEVAVRAGALAASPAPGITAELPAPAAWELEGARGDAAEHGPDGAARPAGRRRSATQVALAVAACALVASLAGWLIASLAGTTAPQARPPGRHPSAPAARTVSVNATALIGQPVRAVVRELRNRGLHVQVSWLPAHGARPGTVVAVQPGGKLRPGTLVHVTAARWARHHPRGHGDGHDGHGHGGPGHGGDGQRGGDGNGQGGD